MYQKVSYFRTLRHHWRSRQPPNFVHLAAQSVQTEVPVDRWSTGEHRGTSNGERPPILKRLCFDTSRSRGSPLSVGFAAVKDALKIFHMSIGNLCKAGWWWWWFCLWFLTQPENVRVNLNHLRVWKRRSVWNHWVVWMWTLIQIPDVHHHFPHWNCHKKWARYTLFPDKLNSYCWLHSILNPQCFIRIPGPNILQHAPDDGLVPCSQWIQSKTNMIFRSQNVICKWFVLHGLPYLCWFYGGWLSFLWSSNQ